ncbi:MAG: AAA family ATPase [Candidatus Latescibacter sp.]|nr:AAA family ATPase [Candidatus Latescibacter sp.]
MTDLDSFSVKIRNLKCFGYTEQGFDAIKPINLIVGRNNSGKSTLLDLIEYIVNSAFDIPQGLWHGNQRPEVIAESPLTETELKKVFMENTSGGSIPGGNHWQFGQKFIGTMFNWSLSEPNGKRFISIGNCLDGKKHLDGIQGATNYLQRLADVKQNPLAGKEFRRISAERNIEPEQDSSNINVSKSGMFVTNLIQHFINKANLPSDLVETILLDELNDVLKAEARFTDIVCQQLESNLWEIYLEEETKGRIPLSQSGSGLKTIIIVLVYIHLLPVVAKKDLSKFIFGFEELENCLHPALLRRLLFYIYQQAKSHGCVFFISTHSNVEIDLFGKNEDAQIIHVTHDGNQAFCRTVKTYIENRGILDDLDVRASDLLQSNGIIWVEGPSDRIYFNRWISLWTDSKMTEGIHYQCVFYGGRLLSHLSSIEPDFVEEGVSILRVNKNAIILIDSDKSSKQSSLNGTKKRIIKEIEQNEGTAWVTKGKEIENYIPADAIAEWLDKRDIDQVGQYDDFLEYLNKIKKGEGNYYACRKPLLAEQLIPYMTRENIVNVLDLAERLEGICKIISQWNSL